METKLTELRLKLRFKYLQLKLPPATEKKIQALLDDKYLHWIKNKGDHTEKMGDPDPNARTMHLIVFLRSH